LQSVVLKLKFYCILLVRDVNRALEVLKPLTLELEASVNKSVNCGSENGSDNGDDSLINSDIKSPISIVHEMALKRKLSVTFEVQSEKGPPHMKVYTTLCTVGTIVVSDDKFICFVKDVSLRSID
jgi:double-stranded RNA-binding protein Staufen